MARSSGMLLCLCIVLLLVTNIASVEQTQVTGSTTKQFYMRGEVVSMLPKTKASSTAVEESFESFERRELADYGSESSHANCSGNC